MHAPSGTSFSTTIVCSLAIALAACGSTPSEQTTPTADPTASATSAPPDRSQLHAALVTAHKKAVDVCFGGFGKGAPYAADLGVDGGTVTSAKFEPLNSKFPDIPTECLEKTFKAMPMAGATEKLHVEFAVKNDACAEPACEKDDLKCTFERDISCSVVER